MQLHRHDVIAGVEIQAGNVSHLEFGGSRISVRIGVLDILRDLGSFAACISFIDRNAIDINDHAVIKRDTTIKGTNVLQVFLGNVEVGTEEIGFVIVCSVEARQHSASNSGWSYVRIGGAAGLITKGAHAQLPLAVVINRFCPDEAVIALGGGITGGVRIVCQIAPHGQLVQSFLRSIVGS